MATATTTWASTTTTMTTTIEKIYWNMDWLGIKNKKSKSASTGSWKEINTVARWIYGKHVSKPKFLRLIREDYQPKKLSVAEIENPSSEVRTGETVGKGQPTVVNKPSSTSCGNRRSRNYHDPVYWVVTGK